MSEYTNRLTEMIKEVPDLSDALSSSISSVQSEVADLTKERDAIKYGVCGEAESQARDIIDNTILVDKAGDYVVYGSTFGTINYSSGNITDWEIYQDILPPLPAPQIPVPTVVYTYTEGDYPDLDQLVEDYDFGNDYITRPLTTGATYGLSPNISSLREARDILQENKDKVDDSIDVFSRYAT
jgi:hypothetical protein